jgi:SAM-dependent methyltransferase
MVIGDLMSTPLARHWDDRYRASDAGEFSWFQAEPVMSLRLLTELAPRPGSIIDVGAGASVLVDALLDTGFDDVTVLDVSDEALALVRTRLARRSGEVTFEVADLLAWSPNRQWDAWHDRAVFHFLVEPDDRATYVAAASRAIAPGGVAVIGTFAPDGPEQCSGLPTARYDAEGLAHEFGPAFRLEQAEREIHRTPAGGSQPFTWVVLRRTKV